MADQQHHHRSVSSTAMDSDSIQTMVNSLVQNPQSQATISLILSRGGEFTTPPTTPEIPQNQNGRGAGGLVVGPAAARPRPSSLLAANSHRPTPTTYQTSQSEFHAIIFP